MKRIYPRQKQILIASIISIGVTAALLWSPGSGSRARTQDRQLRLGDPLNVSNSKRIALVIGNGAYTNASPLKNPPNDARAMAATLQSLGFDVTRGINTNQRELKGLIREFGQKLKAGGSGLFYYAGHGVQKEYPQGRYAPLARMRLNRLESSNRKAASSTPTNTSGASTSPLKRSVQNRVGMDLVLILPGNFQMGSTNGESDEKPVHEVTISYPFYIARTEVTQAQWQAVMGNNPSHFKGDNLPVETVSWGDAQAFIQKLNQQDDGYNYGVRVAAVART